MVYVLRAKVLKTANIPCVRETILYVCIFIYIYINTHNSNQNEPGLYMFLLGKPTSAWFVNATIDGGT